MTNSMPRFAVVSHRRHLGYVNAVSLVQARRRAARLFPDYATSLEVELCANVAPRDADRFAANRLEQGKRNRRYTDAAAFEARRRALIAEVMG